MKRYFAYVVVAISELFLFRNYSSHHAVIHFFLHALIGLSVALAIFIVLTLKAKNPEHLVPLAFGLHQYAMSPDYLYYFGHPHQAWMNVFLGHLWIDSLPYRGWVVPFIAVILGGSYAAARSHTTSKLSLVEP